MVKKLLQRKNLDQDQIKLQEEDLSQENSQISHVDMLNMEDITENMEIPFQDFRKSFSVFNNRNDPSILKSFIKIKSQLELDRFAKIISQLQSFSKQAVSEPLEIEKEKEAQKNPNQFLSICKIPDSTTIFIHIFSVSSKRCHIKISNVSGYIFAYFTDIMSSRKFYKLYKLLAKIGNKSLFIIKDQYEYVSKDSSFIKKVADYAKNFCYYCPIANHDLNSKFTNINLEEQKLIPIQINKKQEKNKSNKKQKKQKKQQNFLWVQNSTFWYFSSIFIKQQQKPSLWLNQMKNIQFKIQNPIFSNQIKEINDQSYNFIIKIVLINLSLIRKIQNTQLLYQSLQNMIQDQRNQPTKKEEPNFGNPNDHFPELIKTSKQCAHCQNNKERMSIDSSKKQIYRKCQDSSIKIEKNQTTQGTCSKNKVLNFGCGQQIQKYKKSKTKYRCQGCSAQAQKDIPLCLDCFEGYHKKKQQAKRKKIKKAEYMAKIKQEKQKDKLKKQKQIKQMELTEKVKEEQGGLNVFERNTVKKGKNSDEDQQCKMDEYQDQEYIMDEDKSEQDMHDSNGQYKTFPQNESNLSDDDSDSDSTYSIGTLKKLSYLYQNKEYNQILQKFQQQKALFFNIFTQLIKHKKTRIIATITAQYLKFKAISMLDHEGND